MTRKPRAPKKKGREKAKEQAGRLKPGDLVESEGGAFEVVAVDAPLAEEQRYRVRLQGAQDVLWMRQRPTADGFGVEIEALERVHGEHRFHLLPRLVARWSNHRGAFLVLERRFAPDFESVWPSPADRSQLAILLEQMLLVLSRLHRSGYILGDLRPRCFAVDASGELQLVELSGLIRRGQPMPSLEASPYAAPERAAGEPATERIDIYSAGALIAALHRGRPLQGDENAAEWLAGSELRDPAISQILRGALAPPDTRFMHIDEMRILVYQLKNECARFPRPVAASSSTVGVSRWRYINEDSAGYQEIAVDYQSRPQHIGFYCVADGMGGHELGERASQLAVLGSLQAFRQLAQEVAFDRLQSDLPAVALALGRAASEIVTTGAGQFPGGARMGTTFTGVLIINDELAAVHVGDSRAVLIRDAQLIPLTLDHSLVASLVRIGQMTPEEAAQSDERNVLVRCIDARLPMDENGFDSLTAVGNPDGRLRVQAGDAIIIISDGVWGVVKDEELVALAGRHPTPQALSDAIVHTAIESGSEDNATALAIVFG